MTNQGSSNKKSGVAHYNLHELIEESSKAKNANKITDISLDENSENAKNSGKKGGHGMGQDDGLGDNRPVKPVTISVVNLDKRTRWEKFTCSCRELTQDICENINWRKFWARFLIIMLFPLTWLLNWLAGSFPQVIEAVYTNGINYITRYGISWLTQIAPFSIGEILIYITIAAIFTSLIVSIVKFIKRKTAYERIFCCVGFVSGICCFAAVAVFTFQLLWGFNHYRCTLSELMRLPIEAAPVSEIADVCEDMAVRAATLRADLIEDENGVCAFSQPKQYYLENADIGIRKASKYFGALDYSPTHAKPVWASKFMSQLGVTGIYFAWTAESNINVDIPIYEIPATVCHELSHQMGVARENEANFVSFISCLNHTEAEYKYSGLMMALKYCMNELYAQGGGESYDKVTALFSDGMLRDFAASREYWQKGEKSVQRVIATAVNDTYLKSNGHSDGVKTYGMFIDLLLAYYREGYMTDI